MHALDNAEDRRWGLLLPVSVILFLSGAAGLLYEVVWFRRLHLVFGVSVFAIGAVVSAFMLGLAAGSRWAASSSWLRKNPLRTYAWLEVGTAVFAAIFPFLVEFLESIYVALFRLLEGQFLILSIIRFLLALPVLLPPTFLMGATLPALAQAVTLGSRNMARIVGWLYAINTFGGVIGTLVAGFFALEYLGIIGSLRLGLAVNVTVALAALLLSRHSAYKEAQPALSTQEAHAKAPRTRESDSGLFGLALWTVALTGLVSMAQEIIWTRALVFFIHNSTYAFSAILAVYLLGIALGAGWGARLVGQGDQVTRKLIATLLALTCATLLAIAIYRHLPALAKPVLGGQLTPGISGLTRKAWVVRDWFTALVGVFAQVAAVVLIPACLFGLVFPLALRMIQATGEPPARLVGKLYAANTLGSVLGTILGTFVLVSLLGTRLALLLLAWLPMPLGFLALSKTGYRRRWSIPAFGGLVVFLLAASFLAAPSGTYRNLFEERFGRVIWFSEGVSESVAICEHPDGSAWIHYSDGRGASGTTSYKGGWLYAHLPLLFHPDPHSALVICFGTGNTLGAASLWPLDTLDGVELSTEVVKASFIFKETNHDVASNPHVNMIVEDGRNYLLGTSKSFDVITEEPPLVHTAGVVNLYSKDFYELCSDRLTDDGIVAVWLATWELAEHEVKMLTRAFVEAFPHVSVWDSMHPGEWILIGSKQPLQLNIDLLEQRITSPALKPDLATIGIDSAADLLSLYVKGDDFLRQFTRGVRPVTDDKSVVDYTIPRHARANFGLGEGLTGGYRIAGIGAHGFVSEVRFQSFDSIYNFRDPVAPLIADFGRHDPDSLLQEVATRARQREIQASRRMSYNLASLAQDFMEVGRAEEAFQTLSQGMSLVRPPATADLFAMEAVLHTRLGQGERAQRALDEALSIDPENVIAKQLLARFGKRRD